MKQQLLLIIFFLSLTNGMLGQTEIQKERFRQLEPNIWMGIWDKEHSSISIKIDTLSYDDIPREIDFRGTVVEALTWKDATGENILIQTVTGYFNWKDYDKDSTDDMIQDKSELYAYLFQRNNSEKEYKRTWRVYDYVECFGVDRFIGFTPKATTITNLDSDGITEITMTYDLVCRGGMDPGIMKIIMYEGTTKYALRGATMIMCGSDTPYGGEFTKSENVKENPIFDAFLVKHWDRNKCEDGRFF